MRFLRHSHSLEMALTADTLAGIVLRNQKRPRNGGCYDSNCRVCRKYIADKFLPFIEREEPVEMVMAAFPFKSGFPYKTISPMSDLAEELAFVHLHAAIGERMREVYEPGGKIIIGSDGLPFYHIAEKFTDGFSVSCVQDYLRGNRDAIRRNHLDSLTILSLEDFFPGENSLDSKKERLLKEYSWRTYEEVVRETRSGERQNETYSQMKKYMGETLKSSLIVQEKLKEGEWSRNRLEKEAGDMAKEIMWISEAYRNLLMEKHPQALRLSIHPLPLHESVATGKEKVGFEMGDDRTLWFARLADTASITPWHSVAVVDEETQRYAFMKRQEAERLGASLSFTNGVPTHYTMPPQAKEKSDGSNADAA